jgi:hypothetical protein
MSWIVLFLCQTLDAGTFPPSPLPRIFEMQEPRERGDLEERIGAEAYALYTSWDSSLRIRDGWGGGIDLKLGVDTGSHAMLEFRLGYAAWNTTDDPSQAEPGMAKVRQYRLGVGGDFLVKHLEFGVYGNVGVYHFARTGDSSTAGFLEFEGAMGWRPIPEVKIGLVGMLTFSNTDFNRSSTHFIVNGSIGPALEVKF